MKAGFREWARGCRDGIPIALGYLAVSFSFGILALRSGLTVGQAAMISLFNVTSAGQFASLSIISSGGSYVELALSQLVINLRYCLMSASLSQKVDRKALPKPELTKRKMTEAGESAPLNVLEQELSELVKSSANIDGFSLTDPLIYCGLTSLSALRLATELYKKYGVSVDMKSFVKTATLQSIENAVLASLLSGKPVLTEETGQGETGPVPLTFQQAGLYFECMKAPHETVYNLPMCWTLPASVDPEKVCESFLKVVRCHPALLSRFETQGGEVKLVPIAEEPTVEILTVTDEQFPAFKADFLKPFNLSEGPLFRAAVVRTGAGLFLFTDFHHLIFDGRSLDVFMSEFCAAMEGMEPQSESYSYFNYASDQKASEGGEEFTAAESFFKERMDGFESASAILPDLEKEEGPGTVVSLEQALGTDINKRCIELGISPASYCLAAAYLAVGAFCGSKKVFLCTVSNGRSDLKVSDTVGMFVNTLALSGEIKDGNVSDFLKETDRIFSESRAHEYYPFSKVSSDYGFQPQIMLAYQVGLLEEYKVGGKVLACEDLAGPTPMFPISIFVNGVEGPESLLFQYDATLYSPELIQSFADTVNHFIRQMLTDGKVEALTPSDARQKALLDSFNAWTLPVDGRETIVSLFRRQASATPKAPAVRFEGKELTYGELDDLTDRLASRISSLGLGREDVVSVLIGRSEMMAVASLGALKAGCAYQPLDPSYPTERLSFMVKDAKSSLLTADTGLEGLVSGYDGPVLSTAQVPSLPRGRAEVPDPRHNDLFILLYTSGTTGVPKGVRLTHRNVSTFARNNAKSLGISDRSHTAAYASFGFDASMCDLSTALASGAALYIIPDEIRLDLPALDEFFTKNRISHLLMTTQVATQFAVNFPDNDSLSRSADGWITWHGGDPVAIEGI